jgi:hypothetical protein
MTGLNGNLLTDANASEGAPEAARTQFKFTVNTQQATQINMARRRSGYGTQSAFLAAAVLNYIEDQSYDGAPDLGRMGKQLNEIRALADGRKTAVNKAQAERLIEAFLEALRRMPR